MWLTASILSVPTQARCDVLFFTFILQIRAMARPCVICPLQTAHCIPQPRPGAEIRVPGSPQLPCLGVISSISYVLPISPLCLA